MKRILLLSYYYPPYTGIEGNRVHSWANFLSKNGFYVTVITRQWKTGGQHDWKDYFSEYGDKIDVEIINESLKVVRVPYVLDKTYKFFSSLPLSSVYYWLKKIQGYFHIETDAHRSLKDVAVDELEREQYNYIIVSSPPLNIVRLGHELKRIFSVPLVVDFRDSFNNHLLNPSYKPYGRERIEGMLFKRKLRHWLYRADMVIGVSQAVLNTLPLSSAIPKVIVMNGYEEDAINHKPDVTTDKFIISLVGSIYATQDIEFMADGLALFLNKVVDPNVEIRFVGIGTRLEVRGRIERLVDSRYLNFSNRVSRAEAIRLMHQSNILLQIGWKGYKGFCPGKVFEYFAAKRNILNAPGDGDLTDRLLNETSAGKSVETVDEMADYLVQKYKEWKANGSLVYEGRQDVIVKYSRKCQNRRLADALNAFRA